MTRSGCRLFLRAGDLGAAQRADPMMLLPSDAVDPPSAKAVNARASSSSSPSWAKRLTRTGGSHEPCTRSSERRRDVVMSPKLRARRGRVARIVPSASGSTADRRWELRSRYAAIGCARRWLSSITTSPGVLRTAIPPRVATRLSAGTTDEPVAHRGESCRRVTSSRGMSLHPPEHDLRPTLGAHKMTLSAGSVIDTDLSTPDPFAKSSLTSAAAAGDFESRNDPAAAPAVRKPASVEPPTGQRRAPTGCPRRSGVFPLTSVASTCSSVAP